MENIIEVEHLSKVYKLGTMNAGSLRQDLKHWLSAMFRRKDPFFQNPEDTQGMLWALKDVSFDVREGEAFGIIGHNGSGKSTLLKILSKVTLPTHGVVRGRGRINSLLEIGTGFHEELTGRENVYLNGYFLGMSRQEIHQKFDEIVAFSEVSQFIDTPVKRYSSGMYVRLAFAVAAHLEPDILIVDEVLAVGDSEFQKKCLAKMNDVAGKEGRTILFVSHSMQSVQNLCQRAMLLNKGQVITVGPSDKVVHSYLAGIQSTKLSQLWSREDAPGNDLLRIHQVALTPAFPEGMSVIDIRTQLSLQFEFQLSRSSRNFITGIHLFTSGGECIFNITSAPADLQPGTYRGELTIPGHFLNDGSYEIAIVFLQEHIEEVFYLRDAVSFDVDDFREHQQWYGKWAGYVRPNFPISIQQVIPQL